MKPEINHDFDKLLDDLKKLDEKTLQKALGAGLTYAAKPVKEKLKSAAPVEKAVLKAAVGQRVLNNKIKAILNIPRNKRAIAVGLIRQTQAVKLRKKLKKITLPALVSILNKGAKPHMIFPRKKSGKKFLKLRGGQLVKSVKHPGVKGTGFVDKAYKQGDAEVQTRFYLGLANFMDRLHAAR